MPRPNRPRSIGGEDNLADRIAYERDRRGWTYEGLAKRMTDAGCAIQGSAIYRVEKGQPRRHVTVDELLALGVVFELDVTDLLKPVGLIGDAEAQHLTDEWLARQGEIADRTVRADQLIERLEQLAATGSLRAFPVHDFLGSGLLKGIRDAQQHALASFEMLRYDRVHNSNSASDIDALVNRARSVSHLDKDGRAQHSPEPDDDPTPEGPR